MTRQEEMQKIGDISEVHTISGSAIQNDQDGRITSFKYLDDILDRDLRGIGKKEVTDNIDRLHQRLKSLKASGMPEGREKELDDLIMSLKGATDIVNETWERSN